MQQASPDGKWVALARTDNTDTIGNVEYTIVSLKEAGIWHRSQQSVVFDGIDDEKNFGLRWISPTKLEVTVADGTNIVQRTASDSGITVSIKFKENPGLHSKN